VRVIVLALALIGLVTVPSAVAVERTTRDGQGRLIRFDVAAPNVDIRFHTRILRAAIHGREISDVLIRVVPRTRLARECRSRDSGGCYQRRAAGPRIVLPAGETDRERHTLLHEYGHHIDYSVGNRGLAEPNGTPGWWVARDIAARLRTGQVALSYARGWDRSVGEIFAEDYARLHGPRGLYRIPWLRPPSPGLRAILRRDLRERSAPTPPAPVATDPRGGYTIPGTLDTGSSRSLSFTRTLAGPLTIGVTARRIGGPPRIAVRLECGGRRIAGGTATEGRPVTIAPRDAPAGRCRLELAARAPSAYTLAITLSG
jgi:hypothetical protein